MQNYIAQQEKKIAEKELERQKVEKELKVFKEAASLRELNLVKQTSLAEWQRKGLMVETEKKRKKFQEELEKKQKEIKEIR